MGYYTSYTLETDAEDDQPIVDALREKEVIGGALSEGFEVYESVKWYEHEDDMRSISKAFPAVLFHLHGEGEENGDLWDKYFKNGKMQVCKAVISYPAYDESKLE